MPKRALHLGIGAHTDEAQVRKPEDGCAEHLVPSPDRGPVPDKKRTDMHNE